MPCSGAVGWKPATAKGGEGILLPAGTPDRPLISHLRCQLPPEGKPTCFATLGFLMRSFSTIGPTGLANRLPLGGKVGRANGPGRMRASVEDSTALVIDAPTPSVADFRFPQKAE